MPGLSISLGKGAHQRQQAMESTYFPVDDQVYRHQTEQLSVRVWGSDQDCGISHHRGVMLAFEGYLIHCPLRGEALRVMLADLFLEQGESFVNQVHGLFRMVVHHRGVTHIYGDHLAAKPLFYAASEGQGDLCSQAAPLIETGVVSPELNGAAMVQFMLAGRFFAGSTLLRNLHQAPPGVYFTFDDIGLHRKVWYRYELKPKEWTDDQVLPALKVCLDRAIMGHWYRAKRPFLQLSGGYDSRYILNTIAEYLDDPEQIYASLWGEPSNNPDCDAAWAERECSRQGGTFDFQPIRGEIHRLFKPFFAAQSGMCEQIFTHVDCMVQCSRLRDQMGFRSMFRADECFGPNGGPPADQRAAMAIMGLIGHQQVDGISDWFTADVSAWLNDHDQRMAELTAIAQDPADLRDLLYFQERLPSLQMHLGDHRSHFIENHYPLLDREVLDLVATLPAEMRTNKQIFRDCFHHYYPTAGFAEVCNGYRWERLLEDPVAGFLEERISSLPEPLNSAFFNQALAELRTGAWLSPNPAAGGLSSPPLNRLITRAIVLGRWFEQWPLS